MLCFGCDKDVLKPLYFATKILSLQACGVLLSRFIARTSLVWVLSRQTFRQLMQKQHQLVFSQREIFLNSVPILSPLDKEERLKVAELLEEKEFPPGTVVMQQGEKGDMFYIIMEVQVALCLFARRLCFSQVASVLSMTLWCGEFSWVPEIAAMMP